MDYDYMSLPYMVSNSVAIFIALSSIVWPTVARVLLSAIFITAFFVNLYVAHVNPNAYLEFGVLTSNDFYRAMILGYFSRHIQTYVGLIVICQLFIGIFTSYRGKLMTIAMIGGTVFLLAIMPLGIGSAFPSSLIMALAYLTLLSRKIDFNIYEFFQKKTSYTNR